jgi:hypothetical protein
VQAGASIIVFYEPISWLAHACRADAALARAVHSAGRRRRRSRRSRAEVTAKASQCCEVAIGCRRRPGFGAARQAKAFGKAWLAAPGRRTARMRDACCGGRWRCRTQQQVGSLSALADDSIPYGLVSAASIFSFSFLWRSEF